MPETMRATMQVMEVARPGGPEVVQAAARSVPEPEPTEVLVRVRAAGLNPVDWKTRAGGGVSGLLGAGPWVLGWDVAGEVVELGGGVTRFAVGDRVFGSSPGSPTGSTTSRRPGSRSPG